MASHAVRETSISEAATKMKGVFIRKGTIQICPMNTMPRIRKRLPSSRITRTKFVLKGDAAVIIVEVTGTTGPKLSNT